MSQVNPGLNKLWTFIKSFRLSASGAWSLLFHKLWTGGEFEWKDPSSRVPCRDTLPYCAHKQYQGRLTWSVVGPGLWSVWIFVEVCNFCRVIYNPVTTTEGKKSFAVCSKGLYFPTDDFSLRLLEWIEVHRALGADKITLPNLEVHPNMKKVVSRYYLGLITLIMSPQVLEYYVQSGYLEITPVTLPDNQFPLHLYIQQYGIQPMEFEMVAMNDCFYRNIYRFCL